MNLKSIIKKVLKEEVEIPAMLRRRARQLDDELTIVLRNFPDRISMCDFNDEEEFSEYIIETSIENTYWTYFGNIDLNSKLWSQLYEGMLTYYKTMFGEGLKEKYRDGCTNSSINENTDTLPLNVRRRYPEIMSLLKKIMSNTYPENYDDFLQYKTEILTKIIINYINEHSYDEAVKFAEIVNGYFIDEIENFYNESIK